MKKNILAFLLSAAVIAASGCTAGAPAATTASSAESSTAKSTEPSPAPEFSETQTEKTENAAETSSAPVTEETTAEETSAPETDEQPITTEGLPEAEKTPLLTYGDNVIFYAEDAVDSTEWSVEFGAAMVRESAGLWDRSDVNPDNFSADDYAYNGEMVKSPVFRKVEDGDVISGYTVRNPLYSVGKYQDENGETQYYSVSNYLEIEEDMTLTGVLRYYPNDFYDIFSGSLFFIPDSSYKNMPITSITGNYGGYGEDGGMLSFFMDENGSEVGPAVFADAPMFYVGNLFRDYAADTELGEIISDSSVYLCTDVEITLTSVQVGWNEQGHFSDRAMIKSVKAI